MTRLPAEGVDVVLGGELYRVRESTRIDDYGAVVWDRNEILFCAGMDLEHHLQTAIHEGLHAICPDHNEDWATQSEKEMYIFLLETVPELRELIRNAKATQHRHDP